jgi:hypothetical protein
VLATVLFTDIVGSAERAGLEIPGWHERLEMHDQMPAWSRVRRSAREDDG